MPTQATVIGGSEKLSKKKVFYEGTDMLHTGYALCYNRDYGTASASDINRACRVEKPATANLLWFAGVVVEGYDGVTGPCVVEITVPSFGLVEAFCEENCTLGTTVLATKDGTYALAETAASDCAMAFQTVDRSSTNGLVLVQLEPIRLS